MRLFSSIAITMTLLAVISAQPAAADTIAAGVTVDSYSYTHHFNDYTMGYRFQATDDASVVALGVWDAGGNGLSENHDVGLWTDDGTVLLASIAVYAGTGSYLSEGFRWRDLSAAVALEAGEYYRVGAYYDGTNADAVAYSQYTSISVDSRISYEGWASVTESHGQLAFTDKTGVGGLSETYFGGGNVRLGDSVVPEPTSLGLLALGLATLAAVRLRRRRMATA